VISKKPGRERLPQPASQGHRTLLLRERSNAVSRETILTEVWGIEYYGTTRTLDQLVVKLRQKIEATPAEPRYLLTVHGLGYRLEA
jgi:DNA-binding response OmpR family regulator